MGSVSIPLLSRFNDLVLPQEFDERLSKLPSHLLQTLERISSARSISRSRRLIPDFTRGLEKKSCDTIYCILDVVILDPGMLPPENQWFVRVKYQIEDSCHIYSTFCLEDLDQVKTKKPSIKCKPGDWIEYIDPRYEKSLDPERVTGRVKEVKENLKGRITSVVVQRTILSDVLISSPTPEGSLPPAHLSRLQIEAVRPKKNSREIILLLERGSRSKLAEVEVEIEKVYGFISVFVSCRDMLMADVLPDSKFEYRMIAGTFDAISCDKIRSSKSGILQCHPNDFDESLAEKLFPDKAFISVQRWRRNTRNVLTLQETSRILNCKCMIIVVD